MRYITLAMALTVCYPVLAQAPPRVYFDEQDEFEAQMKTSTSIDFAGLVIDTPVPEVTVGHIRFSSEGITINDGKLTATDDLLTIQLPQGYNAVGFLLDNPIYGSRWDLYRNGTVIDARLLSGKPFNGWVFPKGSVTHIYYDQSRTLPTLTGVIFGRGIGTIIPEPGSVALALLATLGLAMRAFRQAY